MKVKELNPGDSLPLRYEDQHIARGFYPLLNGTWILAIITWFMYLLIFRVDHETSGSVAPFVVMLVLFAIPATALFAYGLHRMLYRARVTIDHKRVDATIRGLRGTRSWTEPLDAYLGVFARTKKMGSRDKGRRHITAWIVSLIHSSDRHRDVLLCRTGTQIDLRAASEKFAKLLGVPVLSETTDERPALTRALGIPRFGVSREQIYAKREAADLDKSVAQLAAENKLEIPEAPAAPPAEKSVYSVKKADGYTFTSSFWQLGVALSVLPLLGGSALLFWYFGPGVDPGRVNPYYVLGGGVLFTLMGLAAAVYGTLSRQELDVTPARVRKRTFLAGRLRGEAIIPASEVEEVKAVPSVGVSVISDQGSVTFYTHAGKSDVEKIHAALLATLASEPARDNEPEAGAVDTRKVGAARLVAQAEMYAGRSPDVIWQKLEQLGNSESTIAEGMRQISEDPRNPHAATVRSFLEQRRAPPAPADPLPAKHASRSSRAFSVFCVVISTVMGVIYLFSGSTEIQTERSPAPVAETKPADRAQIEQKFQNFDLQPRADVGFVLIGGRGLIAEARGDDLFITVDNIVLENRAGVPGRGMRYSRLGLAVTPTASGGRQEPERVWDEDTKGDLGPESPAHQLTERVFHLPEMAEKCAQECRARLMISVQTPSGSTHEEYSEFTSFRLKSESHSVAAEPAPSQSWGVYYGRAIQRRNNGQHREALRLFQEAAYFIEKNLGPDHPAKARTLATAAEIHKDLRQHAQYESAMIEAYEILAKYSDAEIKQLLGTNVQHIDQESVARTLAEFYWGQGRHDKSNEYYKHAHTAAPGLDITDDDRNVRLAYSAAGIMATACMLKNYDEAATALEELKRRALSARANDRESLDYWIKSGESRIQERRC